MAEWIVMKKKDYSIVVNIYLEAAWKRMVAHLVDTVARELGAEDLEYHSKLMMALHHDISPGRRV